MRRLLVCLGVLLFVIGADAAQPETSTEAESGEKDIEILERNIRLDFRIAPGKKGDEGIFIVTASSWYETEIRFTGKGSLVTFALSGHVRMLEDGRLFVTYGGHLEFDGKDGKAAFSVDSSALLKPGQEMDIASMGDKKLAVRASYVERQ